MTQTPRMKIIFAGSGEFGLRQPIMQLTRRLQFPNAHLRPPQYRTRIHPLRQSNHRIPRHHLPAHDRPIDRGGTPVLREQ